jgi:release factor glutamine methyltransferase
VDLLVANLPYVTSSEHAGLQPEVREHEPSLALDGGADGLDLIRRVLTEAVPHLQPHAVLVLEIGAEQAEDAAGAAAEAFPGAQIAVLSDLTGRPRLLVIHT